MSLGTGEQPCKLSTDDLRTSQPSVNPSHACPSPYSPHSETWNTFGYIAGQSNWNWASQQAVRVAGSLIMWRVGKGMPAKYNIEGECSKGGASEGGNRGRRGTGWREGVCWV